MNKLGREPQGDAPRKISRLYLVLVLSVLVLSLKQEDVYKFSLIKRM